MFRLKVDRRLSLLLHYLKYEKIRFLLSLFFQLLYIGLEVGATYALTLMIDRAFPVTGFELKNFRFYFLFFVIFRLLSIPFQVLSRYLATLLATHLILHIQMDLFDRVNRLPLAYFDAMPAGKLVSRMTYDIDNIDTLYSNIFTRFLTAILYLVVSFIPLFYRSPKIALTCLLILGGLLILYRFNAKWSLPLSQRASQTNSEMSAGITEVLNYRETVQAFGVQEAVLRYLGKIFSRSFETSKANNKITAYSEESAIRLVFELAKFVVLAGIGWMALKQPDPSLVATFYLFTASMQNIISQVVTLFFALPAMTKAYAASEKIMELLEKPVARQLEPAVGEEARALQLQDDQQGTQVRSYLHFDQICFSYLPQTPVLKQVSFTVEKGQTVALTGPTGCGKSTLLSLLLGFYDLDSGAIRYQGQDIRRMGKLAWRQHLGVVLQDPYLLTGTLYSNIALGRPEITRAVAEQALLEVGGEIILRRHPEGLDTPIKESGHGLSSGEAQIISFARAMAHNPEILLLDEATAHIDSETEHYIQKGFSRLREGRTLFVVAHRLSTIRHADQILYFEKGELKARGTHDELMQEGGGYAQLVQAGQDAFIDA